MKINLEKIQRILAWSSNLKFQDRYAELIKDLVSCNEIPRTNAAFRVFLTLNAQIILQFFNSKFR